jgi:hypothetical protein
MPRIAIKRFSRRQPVPKGGLHPMFLPPPGSDPLAHAVRQGEQAESDGAVAVPAGVLADARALDPGEQA